MTRRSSKNKKAATICISQAYKFYGNKKNPVNVLNGLNLIVSKGSIYGLLGASGCGKTTLLSCIVGRQKLDSGDVWVLGTNSSSSSVLGPRIGFMPQETALYDLFTIRETLVFFGLIYGMTTNEIDEKIDNLLSLLQLPCCSTLLLVLDEPTVGLDCLLRNLIWDYLVDLTKTKKTTVIITTHYIEETRRANMIGIMREGILLAQESPANLMRKYNRDNIQDVILELSVKQNIGKLKSNTRINKKVKEKVSKTISENFKPIKQSHMTALMLKNFLWTMRNIKVTTLLLIMSVLNVIFCFLAIGRDPTGLKLSVTNHELNKLNVEEQNCPTTDGCNYEMLSCRYLKYLKQRQISLTYYATEHDALETVRNGESWGALIFAQNYSDAFVERLENGLDINDFDIDSSAIMVQLDMSNYLIAEHIQRNIFYAYLNSSRSLMNSCNINPTLLHTPLSFKTPIYGEEEPNFTNYMAPGIILMVVFFFSVELSVGIMITERKDYIYVRYLIAGVSEVELLLSHVITSSLLMFVQTFMVFNICFYVFKLPCDELMLVFWLFVLTGFCGLSFGFFVSCLFEDTITASYVAVGSFLITFYMSGTVWPLEGMPFVLKIIAYCLPITKSTEALRSILYRGWNFENLNVYGSFVSTALWILVFFTSSIIIIKLKKN